MFSAGIDVGLELTKIVILDDNAVVARSIGKSGGAGRKEKVTELWEKTLSAHGIDPENVKKIAATGQGKTDAAVTNYTVVEPVAAARAARHILPDAKTVVDIGAEQTRVVTLGEGDSILEVALNQKCGACLGLHLKFMAERLGLSLEELSELEVCGGGGHTVNDGCCVFAELDALELLNCKCHVEDVAKAVVESAAVRINSLFNDKTAPDKEKSVLFGGLSLNKALVKALEKRSGVKFVIPEYSEYGCALGAALIAATI